MSVQIRMHKAGNEVDYKVVLLRSGYYILDGEYHFLSYAGFESEKESVEFLKNKFEPDSIVTCH